MLMITIYCKWGAGIESPRTKKQQNMWLGSWIDWPGLTDLTLASKIRRKQEWGFLYYCM